MRRLMLLLGMLMITCALVSCSQETTDPITPSIETFDEQILGEGDAELLSQALWWSPWESKNVKVGSCHEVRFAPARKGTHYIQFLNQSNIYNGGTMESCWRKGTGSWNCWAWSDVLSRKRQQTLYSGSADINYRFRFYAKGNYNDVRFYWRFWID